MVSSDEMKEPMLMVCKPEDSESESQNVERNARFAQRMASNTNGGAPLA